MRPPLSELKITIVLSASFEFVEFLHDAADAVVHAFDKPGINRVVLRRVRVRFLLVFLDDVPLGHQGRVDGVMRQVQEERPVLVRLDELQRLVREPVAEEFARGAVGQRGDLVGGKITRRLPGGRAGDVQVEALLVGIECRAAQVPLADARRGEARRLEQPREVHRLQRKVHRPVRHLELREGPHVPRDPIGDVQPRRDTAR